MKSPLVVFQMLDVSTAHLTSQTRDQLDQQGYDGVLCYPKGPWGWFMYVPSLQDGLALAEDAPQDLKQCIEYAQLNKFDWIVFDCEGAVITELPLYEEIGFPDQPNQANGRVLAAAYSRHLTRKLGAPVHAAATDDGKILVSHDRSTRIHGKVSMEFAQCMVMQALPVKG